MFVLGGTGNHRPSFRVYWLCVMGVWVLLIAHINVESALRLRDLVLHVLLRLLQLLLNVQVLRARGKVSSALVLANHALPFELRDADHINSILLGHLLRECFIIRAALVMFVLLFALLDTSLLSASDRASDGESREQLVHAAFLCAHHIVQMILHLVILLLPVALDGLLVEC